MRLWCTRLTSSPADAGGLGQNQKQACAHSPKMENGLKCLKVIVYYAFPVKYAILWMLCSSNGCRKHLSKCLVYILLWLYAIFTIKAKNATDCGALSKCSKLCFICKRTYLIFHINAFFLHITSKYTKNISANKDLYCLTWKQVINATRYNKSQIKTLLSVVTG